MKKVKVRKDKLLATLQSNRETHVADFEIAWDKYHERVVENVEQLLIAAKEARRGEPIHLHVGLVAPGNHVDDYERAVQMLEWEIGDEVELTEQEFSEFVQDDWGWKASFAESNALYTGSSSPSSVGL